MRLLTGESFWSLNAEPAAGLRRLVVSDGPAGVRGEQWDERSTSANVPSPTSLAATWDEALVEELGRLLAFESRRKGVDVLLAPTVNLHRTPYGGRHFECFSEDPLLTARIGVAYVLGLQRSGVAATVKHFVANDSETQRMTLDARVGERALRELYLAPFDAIVNEGGVWSIMAAYNGVNGQPMTENPLMRDILHGEWGFDGVVMSDWFATRTTVPSAVAALDLVMPGPHGPWGDALVAAVRAGEVDEALIDDKVTRILRLASRVGALEDAPSRRGPAVRRRRGRRHAAARGGGGVRAGAQRGRAPARSLRAHAGRDRRPQRRRRAHAGRRQRDGVPALHGLAARRAARRARRRGRGRARDRRHAERPHPRRRAAVDPHAGRRPRGRGALRRGRRHGAGHRGAPRLRLHLDGHVRLRARDPRRRAGRGPRRRAGDRAGTYVVAGSGVGRYALSVGGEQVFDERARAAAGRGHRRGHHDPAAGDPQRRRSRPARASTWCSRTGSARWRPTSATSA